MTAELHDKRETHRFPRRNLRKLKIQNFFYFSAETIDLGLHSKQLFDLKLTGLPQVGAAGKSAALVPSRDQR